MSKDNTKPEPNSRLILALTIIIATGTVALVILTYILVTSSNQNTIKDTSPSVTQTVAEQATPTHLITQNPISTSTLTPQELYSQVNSKSPMISDSLSGPSSSNWEEANSLCYFSMNSYLVYQNTMGDRTQCRLLNPTFSDFAFKANMNILEGDLGGFVFYVSSQDSLNVGYRFVFTPAGVWSLIAASGTTPQILDSGNSNDFTQGYNHWNTIMIIVQGSQFYCFVNGNYVSMFNLGNQGSGLLGFYDYDNSQPTEVGFSNAYIWSLQ